MNVDLSKPPTMQEIEAGRKRFAVLNYLCLALVFLVLFPLGVVFSPLTRTLDVQGAMVFVLVGAVGASAVFLAAIFFASDSWSFVSPTLHALRIANSAGDPIAENYVKEVARQQRALTEKEASALAKRADTARIEAVNDSLLKGQA